MVKTFQIQNFVVRDDSSCLLWAQLLSEERESFQVRAKKRLEAVTSKIFSLKLSNLPPLQTPKIDMAPILRVLLLGLPRFASAFDDLSYTAMRNQVAILHQFQNHLLFQVSSQNAISTKWIAFYPGALLQGGKDWSVSRIPGEKEFLASCLYLINCPFSLQCFKRETLLLSEGDFQLGWASGSGYVMGVLDGKERFRAEDATMPSVPSQVMTDTSYFHGLYSQIIHFCCCVLGFITKVKTVQIRLWKGSAVLNLLIKCTCFWRNSRYIRCPSSFWNTWWGNWPMCFKKEAFTFLYLGNFLSFG